MSNSIRRKLKRKRLGPDEVLAIHGKKLMLPQGIIDPEHSHRYGGIPGRSLQHLQYIG